jgi:hypothetical protein
MSLRRSISGNTSGNMLSLDCKLARNMHLFNRVSHTCGAGKDRIGEIAAYMAEYVRQAAYQMEVS